MHIPDGMLDAKTMAGTWAVAATGLGIGVRAVRTRMTDGRLVLMAVLAALVFALQMLNFPVAGGTSGHFAGGALAAVLLGPWPAMIVMSAVLVVQAFFFADGGVISLGANIVNMAVVAPLVGWWVYSLAVRISDTRSARMAGAFVAAWAACVAAALAAALMLWASGAAPLLFLAGAMTFWHALIGVGEGLVTAGLVGYVFRLRPDLMRADTEILRPRGLALSLGAVAVAATGLSLLASRAPDGLETVAGTLPSLGGAGTASKLSPMAGYIVPGIANEALVGVLAGLVGLIITSVAVYLGLRSLRSRRAARG